MRKKGYVGEPCGGQLHDGETTVRMRDNWQAVCKSRTLYGGPGQAAVGTGREGVGDEQRHDQLPLCQQGPLGCWVGLAQRMRLINEVIALAACSQANRGTAGGVGGGGHAGHGPRRRNDQDGVGAGTRRRGTDGAGCAVDVTGEPPLEVVR